jgi:hypothetical protein
MVQYFLKVVGTQYHFLNQEVVRNYCLRLYTHKLLIDNVYQAQAYQYSVTTYERELSAGNRETTPEGVVTTHGVTGMPGMSSIGFTVSLTYRVTQVSSSTMRSRL